MATVPSVDTFEGLLLDTIVDAHTPTQEPTMARLTNWIRIWMVAILLVALALFLMWRFESNHVVSTLADAMFIAGILALVVDPLLKRDLLAEASRGIFVHLLGFEHHPQVKDKLREIIFDTKLLRESLDIRCSFEPIGDNRFSVTVEYDTEIINPTNIPVPYHPYIAWDRGHDVELLRMSFTSSDDKIKWDEKNVVLKESKEQLGVWEAKIKKVDIKPRVSKVTYRGSGVYRVQVGHPYYSLYMGLPTLRASIRVTPPTGYVVSATPADARNGNYFEYTSIRMKSDHLTIRWKREDETWN
jgi:hypothetical protein